LARASAFSSRRRIASDKDGCGSGCFAIHASTRSRSVAGKRMAATGVFPVGAGPRFFLCNTGFDRAIKLCITRLSARWKAPTFTPGLTTAKVSSQMATATHTTSRFHNLSDAALADELGRVDSISKAAEAEMKALKDEFKARGLSAASGDAFMVTATEQIAGRLDAKAVREYLGAAYSRFEVAVVSTVIRIKAANRTLPIAA
jgi:hypothetical protein